MTLSESKLDKTSRIAWFADKEYEDLFDNNKAAATALRQFGFVRTSRPSLMLVLGGLMGLILFCSLFYHHFVPSKNSCFNIEGRVVTPLVPNAPPGYGTKGTLCPADTSKAALSSDWPQLFSNFSILVTLIFGWWQWTTTRSHSSLAEAFARKLTSNQTIMDKPGKLGHFIGAAQKGSIEPENPGNDQRRAEAVALAPESGDAAPAAQAGNNPLLIESNEAKVIPDIFIYMEMDNLEYVFEKYRDAEISSKSALRQCFIFASRCGDKEFREKAPRFAAIGFYRPDFKKTVDVIAGFAPVHLERMMEKSQESLA